MEISRYDKFVSIKIEDLKDEELRIKYDPPSMYFYKNDKPIHIVRFALKSIFIAKLLYSLDWRTEEITCRVYGYGFAGRSEYLSCSKDVMLKTALYFIRSSVTGGDIEGISSKEFLERYPRPKESYSGWDYSQYIIFDYDGVEKFKIFLRDFVRFVIWDLYVSSYDIIQGTLKSFIRKFINHMNDIASKMDEFNRLREIFMTPHPLRYTIEASYLYNLDKGEIVMKIVPKIYPADMQSLRDKERRDMGRKLFEDLKNEIYGAVDKSSEKYKCEILDIISKKLGKIVDKYGNINIILEKD